MSAHIHWMTPRDIAPCAAISAHTERPWTADEFLSRLREKNCIGMVLESGDRVVGFMVYELHRTRLVLANLAVDPAYRRRTAGSALLAKLAYKLCSHRRESVRCRAPQSDVGTHLFLRACGWRAVFVSEDDYTFEYRPSAEARAQFGYPLQEAAE